MTQARPSPGQHNDPENALPPPGPVYVISETGFGPTGLFDSEEAVDERMRQWRLLNWLSKHFRRAVSTNGQR